ncbi:Txe/YoeB family addiction module toxin [Aerophototrophica crusticola]|uniref:Putative mRNA interferase YoeB n=1 Tax=Aerophototrophica crusticola TaxID=1709002 RepID=A0A858R320_9PROT|nr:Txe/YoeB family addiction module toxin [Rhodospirillaceae bacterium B3]
MRLAFSSESWGQYLNWQDQDSAVLARINSLIRECMRPPFTGLGKPEPLTGYLKGWWSRRITAEYRVVGKPPDQVLEIAACRWHYL